ncbi:unnamed protein product [Paramecium pentaurelia]|uniref:cDENN domain-containing protein n=1 Tax=Paramecium pentaurelia TaxID=43138 RepID=A0A8S1XQ79_9CILI|nr:unnamed protein product [Paramecium pentaurelia]
MQDLKYENEELKQQLKQLQITYNSLRQELEVYRVNIQQYDKEKQQLMEEKNKLEKQSNQEKHNDFEKKIKSIIERLPCQIQMKSLRQISNSTIQKAKGVIKDIAQEYKNAYKQDYHKIQSGNYQSLFESFYIIGVKNEKLDQNKVDKLKPKFLYKQYKNDINAEERNNLKSVESDIKEIFESNFLQVEKLDNDQRIKEKIFEFLCQINEQDLMNNFFFMNLRGAENVFDNFVPKNMKLITEVNNQKQLFMFVLGVDDFMTSFIEGRFKFWKIKKYYCILTYFPIFEIFEKVLQFVGNIIQTKRINLYNQFQQQENQYRLEIQFKQKIYQDIDSLNIIHTAKEQISSYLSELSKQQLNYDQTKLDFHFQSNLLIKKDEKLQQNLTYIVTNEIRITNMLKATHLVMQIFCNQQLGFFNILAEVLKEGQIIFCGQNKSILVQVCYFFHQIIYPFIYIEPAVYYTSIDVVDQLLKQEMSFIVGINNSYNQLIQDLKGKNQEYLQYNTITIVELCNNMTANIHQLPPRDTQQIKQLFSDNRFQEILQNYTPASKLSTEKCQNLLSIIKSKIEKDCLLNILPDQNQNFVFNNQLNTELIKKFMNDNLSGNNNRAFIMQYIFYCIYFQTYLKDKYKCSFD